MLERGRVSVPDHMHDDREDIHREHEEGRPEKQPKDAFLKDESVEKPGRGLPDEVVPVCDLRFRPGITPPRSIA